MHRSLFSPITLAGVLTCVGLAPALPLVAQTSGLTPMALDQPVRGQFQTRDDIHRYVFVAPADRQIVLSSSTPGTSRISVRSPGGQGVDLGGGPTLLPDSGRYTVRVFPEAGHVGPYEFTLHRFSEGVEHGTAAVALGDQVLEGVLDYPGDVDVYVFEGRAGQEIAVELMAVDQRSGIDIGGDVLLPEGGPRSFGDGIGAVGRTDPLGTDLASSSSGPLRLDRTGRYRFRVSQRDYGDDRYVGAYRFRIRSLD